MHSDSEAPLLPFLDDTDGPPPPPSRGHRPTAFICYAHETHSHNQQVTNLTLRLRADGVDCSADIFEVSPPEGWQRWMLRQVKDSDFVIVVCTATHARHIAASPTSTAGRGVRWEDGAILQCLYNEGENRRFIPVVFYKTELHHIPQALKSATYYDLSTHNGYVALHRGLTNQPQVEKPPVGEPTKRLPSLTPTESHVGALLTTCSDPLPLELVARVVDQDATQLLTNLQRLRERGVIAIADNTLLLSAPNADGIPGLSHQEVGFALDAALDFIKAQPNTEGRAQMRNVVALQKAANIAVSATAVSRTFQVIQSFLKSSGDKSLLLEVARRSIDASREPGRGLDQAQDEAVAAICGISWVYQRTGRPAEALAEAERSLQLGEDIDWHKNTAFCHKCLGRLKRLEAEAIQNPSQPAPLLQDSVSFLRKAIQEFEALKKAAEVGDCYSLLARTYLVAGERESARIALNEADRRLIDPKNKDYLDLQIVKGDLMLSVNRRSAEALYSEAIASIKDSGNDAQRSEIAARAYLHRGRVRRRLADGQAQTDFVTAAEIWDRLGDPTADIAHWETLRMAAWMDGETKRMLDCESVGVRVRAARIVNDETERRPVGRSHRRKLTREYLRGVVARAREQLAVDQPVW